MSLYSEVSLEHDLVALVSSIFAELSFIVLGVAFASSSLTFSAVFSAELTIVLSVQLRTLAPFLFGYTL